MIDTRFKRQSAIGIGLIFLSAGLTPDGNNLEAGQRQAAAGFYASRAAEAEPPIVDTVELELCLLQTFAPELTFQRTEAWTTEF